MSPFLALMKPFLLGPISGMQVFLHAWLGSMSPLRGCVHQAGSGEVATKGSFSRREPFPHADLNLLHTLYSR